MNRLNLLVAALVVLCGATAQAENVISRSTMFDGTVYEFTSGRIGADDIPRWTDKSKHPPLAPWAAAEKATGFMPSITPRKNMTWDLESITLHKTSHHPELWLYKIRFCEMPTGSYDGMVQTFEVIVLMNGEVPKPTKKKK